MSVATFDTLAAVRNLEKAGMGTSQAEAVTETIRVAVFQGVATKEDLGELHGDVKAEIGELRAEMKAEIGELRAEIGELRAETKAEIGELRAETKADIARLRAEMKADVAELRAEMKEETASLRTGLESLRADIEKFRAEQTWRMVLIVGAMLGLFTALDRLVLN